MVWQITSDPFKAERWSQLRRAAYIACVTGFCLGMPALLTLLNYESAMAEMLSKTMLGLAELCVYLYLGAGVLDRSKVLDKIGDGFAKKPTVIVQQAGDDK